LISRLPFPAFLQIVLVNTPQTSHSIS
jgi:hypothetical protein